MEKQTLLYHPNYSLPFELRTDASNVAISTILTQNNKLVGIYFKKLFESELKYSTVEKEFLAILRGLQKFRNIVLLSHVKIFSDSRNLTFTGKLTGPRVQKWKLLMEEYDYNILHVFGINNTKPD
ncbi:POL3 [Hepatospora eriocheir]|uniref:POL3 n=1 Tax=Hepatospora eriocheir TaxID=1081669 RepID=A0A1X0QFB7_9MICR|nr:POL3 [Hepatospora eriocheir]